MPVRVQVITCQCNMFLCIVHRLLKRILEEELAAGMYLPSMGMFVDNQDMTRFSTLNSSANALKCAYHICICSACC